MMTREMLIQFIIDSAWHLEDVELVREELEKLSYEELVLEADWYEYLWTK